MDHVADEVHEQPEEAAVDDEVVDAEVFLVGHMTHQCLLAMLIML